MPSESSHSSQTPPSGRAPLIDPGQTFESATDKIAAVVLSRRTTWGWLAGFSVSFALLVLLLGSIAYLLAVGAGIWGLNVPVGWGFAIISFVWWIGIAHGGTLTSAALLLLRQKWRSSVSRFAETTALFAIACAGLFPLLHLGRPWFSYWLLPYPNTMDLWPQFRSALVWDMFAILVYLVVTLLFWYVGLIPDLATLRDAARSRMAGRAYALLSLGWRGDSEHWREHRTARGLLAGLATALVVLHSVGAFNLATTVLPGWHSTILPAYFVAGGMHSGVAMLLVLMIPLRRASRLEEFITGRHLQNLAKLLVGTSWLLAYSYTFQIFIHWYSDDQIRWYAMLMWLVGPYALYFWVTVACNVAAPQVLWSRRARSSPVLLWLVGLAGLVGVWFDRYVNIISSQQRDFLPSSWGPFSATIWDWAIFAGTFGLLFVGLLACLRLLPIISIFETRKLTSERSRERHEPQVPDMPAEQPSLYGMLAEFDSSAALVEAIHRAREAGYEKLEAYSPVPEERVERALGLRRPWLPMLVFLGGATGAAGGYFLQYYLNALNYPINVGGRPLNSWPLFAVVTFEVAVLLASLTAVLGMLVLNGLPRLHHPVFNEPRFSLASRNRFYLCVRSEDLRFIPEHATRRFLEELHPLAVWEARL